MKIDINRLGHTLFFPYPHYLDTETGEIYSQSLLSVSDGHEMMLLPVYTSAPIYQRYLDRLFTENSGIDGAAFAKYPRFRHRNIQYQSDLTDEEYEFIDKAYHFLDELRIESQSYDDDYHSELAYFQDYEEAYMNEFAVSWCTANGFIP